MTTETLWYGFVDEASGPDPFYGGPLVFVAIVTRQPRALDLLIRRVYKKSGRRIGGTGELKASFAEERLVVDVLTRLAKLDVHIVCVTLDKSVIMRPPADVETLYHAAAKLLLLRCIERWPRLEMHFDKRYTNKYQQRQFERYLREGIASFSNVVVTVEQDDSVALKELQAADFVAWAAGQKAKGEIGFWRLIAGRVVVDDVIRQEKW